jgi:hypothetical protein
MNHDEMPSTEQIDCGAVLASYSDVIKRAYVEGLSLGWYAKSESSRIRTLEELGILHSDWTFSEKFHNVLQDVIGNRDIAEIAADDFQRVASRHREWYPHQRLDTRWINEAYRLHGEKRPVHLYKNADRRGVGILGMDELITNQLEESAEWRRLHS